MSPLVMKVRSGVSPKKSLAFRLQLNPNISDLPYRYSPKRTVRCPCLMLCDIRLFCTTLLMLIAKYPSFRASELCKQNLRPILLHNSVSNSHHCGGGGGGQGGSNLPLPLPFNPGSRPVFFGSRPFAFFRLRNIAQCCVIFPFFSRFPPPWESRFPPPLFPPPVHLPPPFLPVSRPPVPPPIIG